MPLPAFDQSPVLTIMTEDGTIKASHTACSSETLGVTFQAPLISQQSVECSYPGGCLQTIIADGLTSNIVGGNMKVKVCGVDASLRADLSSSSQTVFEVP